MFRRLISASSRSGIRTASAKTLSQVSKPLTEDAYREFGEFLWMVMLRLNNRVLGQVFKAVGDCDSTTVCFEGHLLDHMLKYTEIVSGEFPPPAEKPLGLDDIGDYPIPYTHMIKLVKNASEDARCRLHGEPPIHQRTKEETRLVHDFCRTVACRAEKEVFSGEPNVHELQEQARLFGAECYPKFFGLQSTNLSVLIQEHSESYATPVVPRKIFWREYLTRCARSLELAQKVADAGGLPQFPRHGGLVALYNFEKKHAYQLLLNCLKSIDKGYDERKLLWSSFENQQFYTVDVQVPGLTSLNQVQVNVAKDGPGVLVTTEKDVFRPERLAVPPYANVDGAIVNLQDEILTIRLPKGDAVLEGTVPALPVEDFDETKLDKTKNKVDDEHHHEVPALLREEVIVDSASVKPQGDGELEGTALTLPIEDLDETKLDKTKNKPIKATSVDDEHHHILRVEIPGMSREEVIVDNIGPELIIKTSDNVFQQRKFRFPLRADMKQARASFRNGLLTIRVPKSTTAVV
ncbi:uncharacterized protein LOC9640685 [Selaginella moellendorffii]|uniref:uncharacterized protein LOC9640685 n=1 Tax=Selaginella moellendorffii TaxID=88036 RepID=UPI000D1C5C05|nr:uncharacterized protein LOC9640685 [Selaginella moellendorffii]|eukprot:XP_024532681.1 uncharacterized protein LOC9640685 [Selaginella moellendorffii]